MPASRRGFSLVELLMVVTLTGSLAAIVVPRFRVTPRTKVRLAARQLAQDLEFGRSRALAARSVARIAFSPFARSYSGYLDFNRDRVFAQSAEEADSLKGFGTRTLEPGIGFGRPMGVPDLPALPGGGGITLAGELVDFDTRGLTTPFGTRGAVYLTHVDDPQAVAAVSVTAGAGIRAWVYQGGVWR
jgi:prepilin-type N-terminal cleavage/methylation domain-containing protein